MNSKTRIVYDIEYSIDGGRWFTFVNDRFSRLEQARDDFNKPRHDRIKKRIVKVTETRVVIK